MFVKSIVLATALASGPMLVPATASNTFQDHLTTNWDENGDGRISLQEVLQRREALFASFDANDDGFLDPGEVKALDDMRRNERQQMRGQAMMPGPGGPMGQGPRQGMGGPMQANQQNGPCPGGGQMRGHGGPGMQQQGYGYGHGPMGQHMQGGPQYGQWNAPWMGQRPMHGQGWQGGPGMHQGYGYGQGMQQQGYGNGPGPRGPGMGQGMQPGMGRMMDADRDGKISKAEFVNMGERWFARFDRNGDGMIDSRDF